MPELTELLGIPANKVAHVIVRSRDASVKTGAWDEDADPDLADEEADSDSDAETVPEELPRDATRQELREFLDTLDGDEKAALIALAWIGRGTYAPAELNEAISTARAEHGSNASAYLFSLPLLPDYLEDALDQLGISAGELEDGILRLAPM